MSLRYLLDTNIVSWPYLDPAHPVVERLNETVSDCAISSLTYHELRFGVLSRPRGRKRDSLEAYVRDVVLASYPVLSYDQHAAEWHATERARLKTKGVIPPFVDGQIAAVAQVNGLVIVTHNPKDFTHFHGLHVEDWISA